MNVQLKQLIAVFPAVFGIAQALIVSPAQADNKKNDNSSAPIVVHCPYRFAVTQFAVADSIQFPSWEGYQENLNSAVCDMLTTEMVKDGYNMVEREKLKSVMDEQDLGASGRIEKTSAPPIGKLVGADYMIVGTITEWGCTEKNIGGSGNILGGGGWGGWGNSAKYHETDARVKIDYRVVNSKTGVIEPGSAGTAMGENKNQGVSLTRNWWNSIDFSQNDWTSTMIGKATRSAVQQIASQLANWKPTDGGASSRDPLKASVVAIISSDEFVIDHGQDADVRVGDTVDVFRVTPVKNSAGKVVYQNTAKIGTATVEDVQDAGARLKFTEHEPGATTAKEGDMVKTPAGN